MIPPETKDCKKNVRKAIVCIEKSCYTVARIAVETLPVFSNERIYCRFRERKAKTARNLESRKAGDL